MGDDSPTSTARDRLTPNPCANDAVSMAMKNQVAILRYGHSFSATLAVGLDDNKTVATTTIYHQSIVENYEVIFLTTTLIKIPENPEYAPHVHLQPQ